jgi:peptidyl-tRNA hydrolase
MTYVCMYILMRSDMDSLKMSAGKTAAQATHAANQCVFELRNTKPSKYHDHLLDWEENRGFDLLDWEENRGFGTCIVLDIGSEASLQEFVSASKAAGLFAGITHDPTYPVRDGEVTHLIPVNTCGFVFGVKEDCLKVLGTLPLYK